MKKSTLNVIRSNVKAVNATNAFKSAAKNPTKNAANRFLGTASGKKPLSQLDGRSEYDFDTRSQFT